MVEGKRRYHAPVREAQAAQTRARIARAALEEFSVRGWAQATVARIAAGAGVTPQAVHLAVGGKAALLIRAVEVAVAGDEDDTVLAERPSFEPVYAADSSVEQRLAAFVAAVAEVYARAARLFLVLEQARSADPEVDTLAEAAAGRRRAGHRRLVDLLAPDLTDSQREDLTDTVWVLAGPAVYVEFVHRCHWPSQRYQHWLAQTLRRTLLDLTAAHPP